MFISLSISQFAFTEIIGYGLGAGSQKQTESWNHLS